MSPRYRANGPRFVDETIDGEALIMDMLKGSYYSCEWASAYAWNALVAGASVSETAALVAVRYGVDADRVTHDLDAFVDALVRDEILVERTDAVAGPVDPTALDALVPPGEYATLTVEKFTDLADVILLDPVHDVTDAGWPHRA
jgi:hypothetical protein